MNFERAQLVTVTSDYSKKEFREKLVNKRQNTKALPKQIANLFL